MRREAANILHNLASIKQGRGDLQTVKDYLQESLFELGDQAGIGASLAHLGIVNAADGDLQQALNMYATAARIYKETGNLKGQLHIGAGLCALPRGRIAPALFCTPRDEIGADISSCRRLSQYPEVGSTQLPFGSRSTLDHSSP
jgi:hypothetical protein